MGTTDIIRLIAVSALPLLLAITVHEAAHGYAARQLGDRTAELLGRLTLNPLKHIDPVGTVILPLAMIVLGTGYVFGWAKPVPVGVRNLRNPKRDMALVAAAGPASNLAMALGWAALLKLSTVLPATVWIAHPLLLMSQFGVFMNVLLAVINMLPIPPLDGGRVAVGLLPDALAQPLARVEPYGMVVVIALLFTGVLWQLISPPIAAVRAVVLSLVGL